MSDPRPPLPDLPGPVTTFLDQDDDALLLLPGDAAEPGRWPRVAVRRHDRAALRDDLPTGVTAPVVGVLLDDGDGLPLPVLPPGWPALRGVRGRALKRGWWTVLRFAGPVDVAALLVALAGPTAPERGLRVHSPHQGAVDPTGPDPDVPPDVVATPPAVGAYDERVLNPIGFLVAADGPEVDVATLDLRHGPTAGLVRGLRTSIGVRVSSWDAATTAVVGGLAMAGVPVVATTDSAAAVPAELGDAVAAAITAPVDLADPVAREEHSLVLRRAAFDTLSRFAWRRDLGRGAGVAVAGHPSVSVLLATRRDDMLDFALAQVARQRGVADLELVLAPHGFEVSLERVRDLLGPDVPVTVLPQSADTLFGDVLQAAADAASGDVVLKMDDDDWYAPDVVADLLRARAYSGAELVGMPAERHYLVPRDLTVGRGHPSERYATFVAGGTMLLDRATLREVGGFRPVRKYVDAQLLESVLAAGGAVYRTHGLGYVLRRNATGHTWAVDMDYLLDPSRVAATWPGFTPSRLLEPDPRHLP